MLERLLTFWKGKLFALTLLVFAATDFLALHDKQLLIMLILIALVAVYIRLNVVVVIAGLWHVVTEGQVVTDWSTV